MEGEDNSSAAEELLLDAFISYASEDRDSLAKPLAAELGERGYRVWFDEFELSVGDSLREKIDAGLASSRYGIVIFSKAFFQKNWPRRELAGLTAKEVAEGKSILPIWHGVTKQQVLQFSPTLADKVALDSSNCGIPELADAIVQVLKRGR